MQRAIALVDVNNFYASCERVFNPKLEGKAVVVLSNNDGCAIARSAKAKELGIRMGEPYFKIKEAYGKQGVIALSSNYTLYADMSNRVMNIIGSYAPTQEVYSIDESFVDLTGIHQNHVELAKDMRARIKKWTGLPVCVGIGATKTLAKLANHIAKKQAVYNGVCNLNEIDRKVLDEIMSKVKVGEVWGVGRRLTVSLNQMGIKTVLDLKQSNPEHLRQQFSVLMEKTIRELNGIACTELEDVPPNKKEIVSSRSFGQRVRDLIALQEAVSQYTSKAAEKLRNQKSLAGAIQVFIQTSPFGDSPKYANSMVVTIQPTDDTIRLVEIALAILKKLYRRGYDYQKAGVLLGDISQKSLQQTDLFSPANTNRRRLMETLDRVNSKMGKSSLRLASEGINPSWKMRQGNKSKNFTTNWGEILTCD